MKALVDERKLSEDIFKKGQILAPIAFIVASFLIFRSNAGLIASSCCIFMLVYVRKGLDVKILFSYGIVMFLFCSILVFMDSVYATWAAIQGYWLLASAAVGMFIVLLVESEKPALADRKPGIPKKYSKDLMKKSPVA